MKIKMFLSAAVLAGLAMTGWLNLEGNAYAQGQPGTPAMDPDTAEIFSNAPPPPLGFASKEDYLNSFTKQKDLLDAYRAGKISKEEAMIASERLEMALENKASMDIYGKVVDQNSQPVAGAEVQANIDKGVNLIDAVSEEHQTKTDAQGLFHFLGLHGQGMGIRLQKEGYNYDANLPSERPSNYLPDPNTPLIFTMWKLRGAEPMVHTSTHAYIPCDGSLTKFDLLTGKKSPDGEFSVSLTRNPVSIVQGRPFGWSVAFEVTNGGLQAITNLYPNEAPVEGYQSRIAFDFPTNTPQWSSLFTPSLYFKSKDGKMFGRMTIKIMADYQPPPTLFRAEIYANPAGSRNLEFDPSKRIIR
jgi:hypothetical protein